MRPDDPPASARHLAAPNIVPAIWHGLRLAPIQETEAPKRPANFGGSHFHAPGRPTGIGAALGSAEHCPRHVAGPSARPHPRNRGSEMTRQLRRVTLDTAPRAEMGCRSVISVPPRRSIWAPTSASSASRLVPTRFHDVRSPQPRWAGVSRRFLTARRPRECPRERAPRRPHDATERRAWIGCSGLFCPPCASANGCPRPCFVAPKGVLPRPSITPRFTALRFHPTPASFAPFLGEVKRSLGVTVRPTRHAAGAARQAGVR